MSFNNTLKAFRRKNEVEVEIEGSEFVVTVRKASLHNQEFRAKVAEFTRGKRSGKRIHLGTENTSSLTGTNDPKQDAEFFFNIFIVTWRGLKDDNGKEVAPSVTAAVDLFGKTKEGQVLMELILAETTKDENFVLRDQEEDAKLVGESSPSSAS